MSGEVFCDALVRLQEPCRIPAKSFMDCLESNNGVGSAATAASACHGCTMPSMMHIEEPRYG